MNTQDALNILIQAVKVGQSKGAYTLEDAVAIKSAIDVFVKPSVEAKIAQGEQVDNKTVSSTEDAIIDAEKEKLDK